jgi:hypothetical protein
MAKLKRREVSGEASLATSEIAALRAEVHELKEIVHQMVINMDRPSAREQDEIRNRLG